MFLFKIYFTLSYANVMISLLIILGNIYEVAYGVVTKCYYAGGQRVAMRSGGAVSYLLGDHLGSTSITTDAAGLVTSEQRYTAWGEVRYFGGSAGKKYTYTGQYSDVPDFGPLFYNARWLDSYNHLARVPWFESGQGRSFGSPLFFLLAGCQPVH
jgi:hypothetical protein